MNVPKLPRELDICINTSEFQNYFSLHISSGLLNLKKRSKTQAESPLQDEFSFQREAFILTNYEQSKSIKEVQRAFRKELFAQITSVRFRISSHSQEFCHVLKKNQLFNHRSLPADRVRDCVTAENVILSKIQNAPLGRQQESLS